MHPPVALRRAFKSLPAVEYRRTLYRVIRPGFLVPPHLPLSGVGSVLRGARFTPRGGFDTLYLAEDPLTAFVEFHNEALALMRNRDDEFSARLVATASVAPHAELDPDRILDLTRREVRVALGTTRNELAAPWRVYPGPGLPPTQLLGQETFNSKRFQAIRYFSVRNPGGVCVAVFVARLPKGGRAYLDLDDSRNGGPVQHIPAP